MRLGACRRWKQGQTIEEYKSITRVPEDKIKKKKAQLEQRLETLRVTRRNTAGMLAAKRNSG